MNSPRNILSKAPSNLSTRPSTTRNPTMNIAV